jgi:hypothetical protein
VCASQSCGGLGNAQVGAHVDMCPQFFSPAEVKTQRVRIRFQLSLESGDSESVGDWSEFVEGRLQETGGEV